MLGFVPAVSRAPNMNVRRSERSKTKSLKAQLETDVQTKHELLKHRKRARETGVHVGNVHVADEGKEAWSGPSTKTTVDYCSGYGSGPPVKRMRQPEDSPYTPFVGTCKACHVKLISGQGWLLLVQRTGYP